MYFYTLTRMSCLNYDLCLSDNQILALSEVRQYYGSPQGQKSRVLGVASFFNLVCSLLPSYPHAVLTSDVFCTAMP